MKVSRNRADKELKASFDNWKKGTRKNKSQ